MIMEQEADLESRWSWRDEGPVGKGRILALQPT